MTTLSIHCDNLSECNHDEIVRLIKKYDRIEIRPDTNRPDLLLVLSVESAFFPSVDKSYIYPYFQLSYQEPKPAEFNRHRIEVIGVEYFPLDWVDAVAKALVKRKGGAFCMTLDPSGLGLARTAMHTWGFEGRNSRTSKEVFCSTSDEHLLNIIDNVDSVLIRADNGNSVLASIAHSEYPRGEDIVTITVSSDNEGDWNINYYLDCDTQSKEQSKSKALSLLRMHVDTRWSLNFNSY